VKIQGWRECAEAVERRRKFRFSKILDPNLQPLAARQNGSDVAAAKIIFAAPPLKTAASVARLTG
jgi:hypothetical protein